MFSHAQVLWILYNYHDLSHGEMPQKPMPDREYLKKDPSFHAPFENACILAAEIAVRVRRCGFDGMLTEERFGLSGGTPRLANEISDRRKIPIDEVKRRVLSVTWYCAGTDIRDQPYEDWKRDVKHDYGIRYQKFSY